MSTTSGTDYDYVDKTKPAAEATQRTEASQADLNPAFYPANAKSDALLTESERVDPTNRPGPIADLERDDLAEPAELDDEAEEPAEAEDEDEDDSQPGGNASRDEWVDWLAERDGVDTDDLNVEDEGGLGRNALRDKYGA